MTDDEDIELRIRLQKEMVKTALKEGLKEWMDEKFQMVGRWTARAFMVALFGALTYLILLLGGWHGPTR